MRPVVGTMMGCVVAVACSAPLPPPLPDAPSCIAHGGGAWQDEPIPNAIEAMDAWYDRGCRWFEIDFNWTSDGALVAIHDWNADAERLFGPGWSPLWPSLLDIRRFPRGDGLRFATDHDILHWLGQHPGATLVTDVKWDNLQALDRFATDGADVRRRIVPQIYTFDEYRPTCSMGYDRIILTLYRSSVGDDEVVAFARNHALFAVAMDARRAQSGLATRLARQGQAVLVHTVNDMRTVARLRRIGVAGVYSDHLCGDLQ